MGKEWEIFKAQSIDSQLTKRKNIFSWKWEILELALKYKKPTCKPISDDTKYNMFSFCSENVQFLFSFCPENVQFLFRKTPTISPN